MVVVKASTGTFIVTICDSCFGCCCLKLFSDWYDVDSILVNYLPSATFVNKPSCIHLSVFLYLQNKLSKDFVLDFVAYFICFPFLMKDRVGKVCDLVNKESERKIFVFPIHLTHKGFVLVSTQESHCFWEQAAVVPFGFTPRSPRCGPFVFPF